MKNNKKYNFILSGIIIILLSPCILLAVNKTDNAKKLAAQVKAEDKEYKKIKTNHKKGYKSGIWKSNKKDFVKHWINEDIDYFKKVIKLKKDYLFWMKEKTSKGEKVKFRDYKLLKKLTLKERRILYSYYKTLFPKKSPIKKFSKISKKKTQWIKKYKKKKTTNITLITKNKKLDLPIQKRVKSANKLKPARTLKIHTNYYIYIILSIISGSMVFGGTFLITRKLFIKT